MLSVLGTDIRKEITLSKWRQISLAICASAENSGDTWWTLPPPERGSRGNGYPAGGAGRVLATPSLFHSPTEPVLLQQICPFYRPVEPRPRLTLGNNLSRQWSQNLTCFHQWACKIVNHRLIHLNVFGTFLFQSYLSGCSDNTLSIGVALKDLCEFAQKVNAHFNCIKFLFALCSRNGGGDEKCRQGSSQATNH